MNIPTHVLLLTGYAATMATCAPHVLSRSSLPRRSPGLALVLWHASIASAGFAIVLAAFKLMSDSRYLPIGQSDPDAHPVSLAQTLVTVAIGLFILAFASTRLLHAATRRLRAERSMRRRHLALLSMVGRHDPELDATVIPAPTAAAYCVAGTRHVVITEHAVRLLEPRELAAVLAHERAHLSGRHHLLVGWATLLVDAFPDLAALHRLREATSNLVELLADDRARHLVDGSSLAAAIALLGREVPNTGLAATGGQALVRVERLLEPPPQRWSPASIAIAASAPLLVGIPLMLATFPADMLF